MTNTIALLPGVCLYTHSNLSEAFVEHRHQQLGQHDNHHDVVGAYDHGAHERTQLLRVADAGDEERDVRQGEYVPEQGVAGPHKPVRGKNSGNTCQMHFTM